MSDWLGGYTDDGDTDEETYLSPADLDARPHGPVLTCRHCGSSDLNLKSTSSTSIAVEFKCRTCGRGTTHHLPSGYRRAYLAVI